MTRFQSSEANANMSLFRATTHLRAAGMIPCWGWGPPVGPIESGAGVAVFSVSDGRPEPLRSAGPMAAPPEAGAGSTAAIDPGCVGGSAGTVVASAVACRVHRREMPLPPPLLRLP